MAYATGGDVILRLMTAVAELQENMHVQTQQMNGVTQQMNGVTQQMNGVTQQMNVLKATMKENGRQFGRVAKLLGAFAEQNTREHEQLEARVERLEKKASGE
jgi:ABC-type transporter Mla subunit MlaD